MVVVVIRRHPRRHHRARAFPMSPTRRASPRPSRISARSKVPLQLYKLDNFYYPSTQQGLDALVQKPSGEPPAKNWKSGGYLARLPKDPGQSYQYLSPGLKGEIDIFRSVRRQARGDGVDSDVGNWNVKGDAGFSFSNSSRRRHHRSHCNFGSFHRQPRARRPAGHRSPSPAGADGARRRRGAPAGHRARLRPDQGRLLLPQPESRRQMAAAGRHRRAAGTQLEEPFYLQLRVDGRLVAPLDSPPKPTSSTSSSRRSCLLSSGEETAFVLDLRAPQFRAALHARGATCWAGSSSSTRTRLS